MTKPAGNLHPSGTIGEACRAVAASNWTGRARGGTGLGVHVQPESRALALRSPEEADASLLAHLKSLSGQGVRAETRLIFPENRPAYRVTTEVIWSCPTAKIDECRAAIEASMRSAPEAMLAEALYTLRILTRGREQRADADRAAEAMIWIERLRCWPGDIVLAVLRAWTSRADGMWWPTFHDVEAEISQRCSQRRALAAALERQTVLAIDASPADPEARAKVAEEMQKLAEKLAAGKPKPNSAWLKPNSVSPEDALAELEALRDVPIHVSASLSTNLTSNERTE